MNVVFILGESSDTYTNPMDFMGHMEVVDDGESPGRSRGKKKVQLHSFKGIPWWIHGIGVFTYMYHED